MKLSYYNITASKDGRIILFNTIHDSYILMAEEIYQQLQDKSFLDNLSKNHPFLFDKLYKGGMIIEEGNDERQQLIQEYENMTANSTSYSLTLLPSLDCNLRCWYCFEKHIKGSHLNEMMQERIYQHVRKVFTENPAFTRLELELFGGEPLLYFEREVYPLLKRIKSWLSEQGKEVLFFIVTNGVRICRNNLPLFAELGTSFQISIDGYKTTHDKVKFMRDIGTYDHIIEAINMITQNETFMYVNLRINYNDKTLVHLPEIIPDLKNVDRRKICIHLERVWQTSPKGEESCELLKSVIDEFLIHGFNVSYMNLSRRSYSCKSSKNAQAIISYDGAVYKCLGRNFNEQLKEGFLSADGIIEWNETKLQKRMSISTIGNNKCLFCRLLPLCWGPCNQKLLETDSQNIDRFCQLRLMELSLEDYIIYRFNNQYIKQNYKK
ncbi:MAG: radical SAM protein [Parabacteroides sp.]